ncbi:MAG: CDP-alcohol phosphatidyltransferase family protein [Parcubacteria group bacterium]
MKLYPSGHPIAPYDRVLKYIVPFIPARVLPNHITFVRLLGAPILLLLLIDDYYQAGLVLFVLLAFTDMLDGSLARIRNQVTDWGKIWDPIADKLLIGVVVGALLVEINFTLTILLLAFEAAFVLGGAFTVAVKQTTVQADTWGKIKMNLQCLGAACLILGVFGHWPTLLVWAQGFLYACLIFAALSLLKAGRTI